MANGILTVMAHFDGKIFVPHEPVDVPEGTGIRLTVDAVSSALDEERRMSGWLQGKGWIAPDFDAHVLDLRSERSM